MMRGKARLVAMLATLGVLVLSQPAHAQDVRAAVEQLAGQLTKGAPENRQLRLAVADFPDLQGVTSELGRFVASRLTTRLAQGPKFLIVERQRLSQVLTELKFSMSDLVDPTKAKQLGKMAGVEAIVVGSISDFGNQVDVDARIIEIETNRMLLGTSVTIGKDPSVVAMMDRGRQGPVGGLGPPLPPEAPQSPAVGQVASAVGVTAEGMAFQPRGCSRVAEGVVCIVAFINIGAEDRQLTIDTGTCGKLYSRLIDNNGTEYVPLVAAGGQSPQSCSSEGRFPPQLPVNVRFLTKDLPHAAVTHMTVAVGLRYIKDYNWQYFKNLVIVRNIPIGR
jgi:TolB-like protein